MTDLFKIGANDYTALIDRKSYAVNREDVYTAWTDANGKAHRDITRTRISGSFRAGFHRESDLQRFLTDLANEKSPSGSYSVSVYVNNTDQLASAEVFIDTTATVQRDVLNDRFYAEYAVEVSEC